MKPSLRTLLAFEDNIFDAEYRQELERRLPNREQATEILCRIRQCLRDPSLGVPGIVEGREVLSPNRVAEYLDHQLPADEVEPFEDQCLNAEVFLAELASCHQILAHVLGEPARISRDCRRHCYELAYAPKVLPFPGSFENSDRETPGPSSAPAASALSVPLEVDRPLSREPDVFESGDSKKTLVPVPGTAPAVDTTNYETINSAAKPDKSPAADIADPMPKRERGRRLPYGIPYRLLLLLFVLSLGVLAVSRGIITITLPFGESAKRTPDDSPQRQDLRDRHLRKIQEDLTLLSFEPDKGVSAAAPSVENPPETSPQPHAVAPKSTETEAIGTKNTPKKPEHPHHPQPPQTQTVLEIFPITNQDGPPFSSPLDAPTELPASAEPEKPKGLSETEKRPKPDKEGKKDESQKPSNSGPPAKNDLASPASSPTNPPVPAAELPRMDTSLADSSPTASDKKKSDDENPCDTNTSDKSSPEPLLTADTSNNPPKPLHPFELLPENVPLADPPEFHGEKTEVAENVKKPENTANTELALKESNTKNTHEETPGTLAENTVDDKSEEKSGKNAGGNPEETLASATPFDKDEPRSPIGRHFVETSEPVIVTEDLPVVQTIENKRHKRNPLRPGRQNISRSPKNVPVFELLGDLNEIAAELPEKTQDKIPEKAIVPSTPMSKTARLALRPDVPTPTDKEESEPLVSDGATVQKDPPDPSQPSPKQEETAEEEGGEISLESETENKSATSPESTSAGTEAQHLHDPIVRFGQINPMSRIFVHEQAASGAKPLGPPSEPPDFVTSAIANADIAPNAKNTENTLEYPKSVGGDIVPTSFTGKDESETGKKAPLPNDKSLQIPPSFSVTPEASLPATEFPPTTPPASPPAEADPWSVPPPLMPPDTPPVVPPVTPSVMPFVKPTVSPPSPVPHEEPLPDPLPELPPTPPPAQPLNAGTQEEILGRTLPSTSRYLAFLAADADSTWQLGTPDSPLYADQYLLTVAPFRFPLALDNGLAMEMVGDSKLALLPPDEEGIRGIHIDYGRVVVRHASGNTPATNFPTASANRPVKLRIQSESGRGIAEIPPGGVLFIDTFAEIVLPSPPRETSSPADAASGNVSKPVDPADHPSMRNRTVVGFLPERGGAPMFWQGMETPPTTIQAPDGPDSGGSDSSGPGISGEAATALSAASPVPTASFDIPSSILFDDGRYIGAPLRKSPSWILDTGNEQERADLEAEASRAFRQSVDTPTVSCEDALSRLVLHDDPAVRALGCRLWGDLGKFDVPLELLTREPPNDPVRRVLVVYFREVLRRDSETIERLADAVAARAVSEEETTR